MTVFNELAGSRPKPKIINLTTTGDTVIMAGPASGYLTLSDLTWSVKSTNTDLSIWITDGTTNAYYMDTETKSARTHDLISSWHPVLPSSSWVLKARASVGNQIDIIANFIQSGQGGTTTS